MPKKKKVTTRDIAKKCGISQTTVSMILSRKEGMQFSEDTRNMVLDTANKMGYVYKQRAAKPENRTRKTIMIMCPSLSSEYYTTLVRAITLCAKKSGLYTMTTYTMREKNTEEFYLKLAAESEFYGIICTYAPQAIDAINHISQKKPFVLINDYNPELRVPLLELDSRKSGRIVGEHLLSLGHKHISFVSTPLQAKEIPRIRRLDGLRDAFVSAGRALEDVKVLELSDQQWNQAEYANRYYTAGYKLTMQHLDEIEEQQKDPVTAFVGTNDAIAYGIIDALKKRKFSVPKDYSVCGFDNTLAASYSDISLTSLDHSLDEKGKAAVDMLQKQKEDLEAHVDRDKVPVMRLEYEPKLQVRRSTGRAREQ